MKDRTLLVLGLIVVLAAVVVYVNMDFFVSGYEHPDRVKGLLFWQGEDRSQRGLELREGLDLQGGLQVLLQADMTGAERGDLEQAATTIQNRVDALGVTEPLVQTQGEDKIVVELPGVEDPELAVRTIGETALLEFISSGSTPLQSGSEVATSWRYTATLWSDLPEDQKQPFLATVPTKPDETAADEAAAGDEETAGDEAAQDEDQAATDDETADEAAAGDEDTAGDEAAGDEDQAATDDE
ncbi:MAG: hypothetical protein ACK2UL_10635, partial [Anaerolineae bacterium]